MMRKMLISSSSGMVISRRNMEPGGNPESPDAKTSAENLPATFMIFMRLRKRHTDVAATRKGGRLDSQTSHRK